MTAMKLSSVLITGASTGIGRAIALHMDAAGWQVFAGVRRQQDAESLQQAASDRLQPVMLDVTRPAEIQAAFDVVAQKVGDQGLQGVVNNAGIALAGPLEFFPPEQLRRQLEINVIGLHAVTQAFLPLVRAGHGRVVHISSVSGRFSFPFMGPYSASKFAVEAMTDALRRELMPWKIQVISIEPGSIKTPIWEKSIQEVEEIHAQLPPEAQTRYGAEMETIRHWSQHAIKHGEPVELVSAAVAHALTAARPKTRYLIGKRARMQAMIGRLLPDRWQDALLRRTLK